MQAAALRGAAARLSGGSVVRARCARVLSLAALVVAGCGARTGLREPDALVADASFGDAPFVSDGFFPADRMSPSDAPPDAPPGDVNLGPITEQLDGLRWELPCGARAEPEVCDCEDVREVRSRLSAPPGARYRVTLRLRGVAETRAYPGSTPVRGVVVQGGTAPSSDPWNAYELSVSDPPQQFFLNAGESGRYVVALIDETFSFQINAGAVIVLRSRSLDGRQIANYTRLVPPGVRPAPAAFDGQFLQADVVALELLP